MILENIEELSKRAIVFYDGSCGFCQASVQFLLKYNKKQDLYFSALQSDVLQSLVPDAQLPEPLPDSILFWEGGKLYTESEAALRITRHLNFPLSILYYFRFIPLSFRDFVYRFIARHRYSIAGRTDSCMLPSPAQRARFLEF
ncbi:putative DCC family thiol-disulfide oxidoreductase YuxK [Pontibacter aydingkolensis]|uniref:DCC1-like thiol-disulfide oxidoreductase family protein n=1 Tax=Pontibacter aydingkolensis TaxID=1911536 RepID=A0ABS7CX95_9BACT|nr:DCC1-like thiol-disulfide oxidoreductase family protein [Pontibacter aydingkolensis]MBW7468132.1 DCC1-like thiol-disulfide oxidoreductase family protein [Pontibacter aydingkolensis]